MSRTHFNRTGTARFLLSSRGAHRTIAKISLTRLGQKGKGPDNAGEEKRRWCDVRFGEGETLHISYCKIRLEPRWILYFSSDQRCITIKISLYLGSIHYFSVQMDNTSKLFVQTLFSMGSEFGIQAIAGQFSHFDGPELPAGYVGSELGARSTAWVDEGFVDEIS